MSEEARSTSDSYLMGTGDLSPEVKKPEREDDRSPTSSAKVKNACSYISTPPHVFMAHVIDPCCQYDHFPEFNR